MHPWTCQKLWKPESIKYWKKEKGALASFFVDEKRGNPPLFRQKENALYATMKCRRRLETMREVMDNGGMPKNMRQIGEPGTGIRILVEDYAYTYLCQLARENLTGMSTVILLGKIREDQAVCVQGAVELDMGQEMNQWFSGESWRAIFETMKTWFEDLEIVGWGLLNPGFPPALTEGLTAIHNRHFPGKYQVLFQMDILDNEEVFYVRETAGLVPRSGYYIYYEKNDAMQAYMSEQRGGAGIEPEGMIRDRAAMRFRSMMQEKREHHSQRKAVAFLCTACTFLVMVILVIGVTLINNYDRMTQMEHAIYQLSENLDGSETAPQEETQQDEAPEVTEEAVLVENQQAVQEEQPQDAQEETAEEHTESAGTEEPVQEAVSDQVEAAAPEDPEQPEQYEVQQGDTLLEISRRKYGTDQMVKEICAANGLEDSDKIYVGQTIVLP